MRFRQSLTFLLLLMFVSSWGLPWISDQHQFNDDPHWVVQFDRNAGDEARVKVAHEPDDDHCLVCHLQRTLRTASQPSHALHHRLLRVGTPALSGAAITRAALSGRPDVRGPPLTLL